MTLNTRMVFVAAVAVGTLALAGCKKDAGNKEIELPEGRIHIGAQWEGRSLWVESFDPKTATCELSQYKDGKVVEESTITFKNCRTGLGGPIARASLPGGMPPRPTMNRPGSFSRPGMPPNAGSAVPSQPPASSQQPVAPPPQG
jgi:hypothetical protein